MSYIQIVNMKIKIQLQTNVIYLLSGHLKNLAVRPQNSFNPCFNSDDEFQNHIIFRLLDLGEENPKYNNIKFIKIILS